LDRIDLDFWTAKEVARLLTLVENEKRYYQEIIAILPTPLAIVSREQNLVAVNRAFRRQFGPSHDAAGQKRLRDFTSDSSLLAKFSDVIDTETPATAIPVVLSTAEGVAQAFHVSVIPVEDWFHEASREALLVVDEGAKEAPGGTEIPDQAPAVAWRLDYSTKESRFHTAGPALLLASEDVTSWERRVHPDEQARVAAVYEAAADSGNRMAVEYRAVREDGAEIILCDHIQPIREPGHPVILLIVTTVETSRRENRARHTQRRELDALARLARPLAHEFNNQLTVILGHAEEIDLSLPKHDERRPGLDEILKAVERLRSTTMHLLACGRPPAPRQSTLDLNDFLGRLTLPADLKLSETEEPIFADPLQLEQTIGKLAQFAVERLGAARSPRIETGRRWNRFDYGEGVPPGVFVYLTIGPFEDLSSRQLAAWMEPFVVESGRPPQTGLAPEVILLAQMGAWVTPAAGPDGSVIEILFPLAETPDLSPAPGAGVPAPIEGPPLREVVLVAEDEESIRSLVARVLIRQGYRVIEAAGGEDAMRLAEEHPGEIHLIVTDVMLPRIRGTELVRLLRQSRPDLHALYVSGYSDDPELAAGVLPAGDGFLQKPFQLSSLVDTVKQLLGTPRE